MGCTYAKYDADDARYSCGVTGGGCVFMMPDSKRCAELYGEGPDADTERCEDCSEFYLEDGKRCCKKEPYNSDMWNKETMQYERSKYIVCACCGGYTPKHMEKEERVV